MSPYYEDDHVTLYHGDCLENTQWLTADVLVTDPPYGSAPAEAGKHTNDGYGRRNKDGFSKMIANDKDSTVRDKALALWGSRPALVFGSPRRPEPPGDWADRLVWDKKRPGINGGPWRYRHESIFVTAGFERRNNESMSILTAWPDQSLHIHAKPLPLMTALIECAPSGVIADPFSGSGSTLVAARNLGRRAVGVEVDENFCELVAKRLDQMALDFGAGA